MTFVLVWIVGTILFSPYNAAGAQDFHVAKSNTYKSKINKFQSDRRATQLKTFRPKNNLFNAGRSSLNPNTLGAANSKSTDPRALEFRLDELRARREALASRKEALQAQKRALDEQRQTRKRALEEQERARKRALEEQDRALNAQFQTLMSTQAKFLEYQMKSLETKRQSQSVPSADYSMSETDKKRLHGANMRALGDITYQQTSNSVHRYELRTQQRNYEAHKRDLIRRYGP